MNIFGDCCHLAQYRSTPASVLWAVIPFVPLGAEVNMPNLPKQHGDAVLSRDGTVKVKGVKVGVWKYEPPDIFPPQYHFAFAVGDDVVFSRMFKHLFKAELPQFLASVGKLPKEAGEQT